MGTTGCIDREKQAKRCFEMKKMKVLAMLLAACMLLGMLAGCSGRKNPGDTGDAVTLPLTDEEMPVVDGPEIPDDEGPVTVTDMTGREITLEEPAGRVVALAPADCEILFALGAGERLVGRGEYCDYPEAVAEITAVQSGEATNYEQILELGPEVLLMPKMGQSEEQIKFFEDAGIQIVVSDAQDIDGVYEAIRMIGKLVGKSGAAEKLCESMAAAFADVSGKAAAAGEEKSVYFEVSPLEYGLWTAGSGTFMDEIAQMLGLKNAFADVEGWAEISEEQVLERNPDYIVTISMYYGEGPTPVEEIESRTGWENVTAVKNGKILNLQNNELSRPGPRLADGAKALYDFVYGE